MAGTPSPHDDRRHDRGQDRRHDRADRERLARANAANVTLVAELRRWRERAWRAEAEVRRLQAALEAAEAAAAHAAAPRVAEAVAADHLLERARHEAEHLTRQARVRARRLREEAELVRLEAEVAAWCAEEAAGDADGVDDRDGVLVLDADVEAEVAAVFARFMSDEIADEPSRTWVLGGA